MQVVDFNLTFYPQTKSVEIYFLVVLNTDINSRKIDSKGKSYVFTYELPKKIMGKLESIRINPKVKRLLYKESHLTIGYSVNEGLKLMIKKMIPSSSFMHTQEQYAVEIPFLNGLLTIKLSTAQFDALINPPKPKKTVETTEGIARKKEVQRQKSLEREKAGIRAAQELNDKIVKGEANPTKHNFIKIYFTRSPWKNCENCYHLNKGSFCVIHRTEVELNNVCSQFKGIKFLRGGLPQ